jgi:hypothetical protein
MTFYKKKVNKVPKGYRLKPSTHRLIGKIQEMMQADQDKVISSACRKFYFELKEKSTKSLLSQ